MTRIKVASASLAVLLLAACTPAPANARPVPTGGAPGPMLSPHPGGYCATGRLGKRLVVKGKTYVCKGPKPYRWRRA